MHLKKQQKFQISDHIIATDINHEMVLMDSASGQYFSLNTIGALIFKHLQNNHDTQRITALLTEEYSAENTTNIEKDVQELLNTLIEKGIITPLP